MGVVLRKTCSNMFACAGKETVVPAEEDFFVENDQPRQRQCIPRVGFPFQSCEYEANGVLVSKQNIVSIDCRCRGLQLTNLKWHPLGRNVPIVILKTYPWEKRF
jgi:hypothetical protein